jgi:hypothetical protein
LSNIFQRDKSGVFSGAAFSLLFANQRKKFGKINLAFARLLIIFMDKVLVG